MGLPFGNQTWLAGKSQKVSSWENHPSMVDFPLPCLIPGGYTGLMGLIRDFLDNCLDYDGINGITLW